MALKPAPSWGSPSVTPGDGSAVLKVLAAAPGDTVVVRVQRMLPNQSWSPLAGAPSRVGSGDLALSGLTNLQGYVAAIHALDGDLISEFSGLRYFTPTDGSASDVDLLMAAIAAQLNLLGITSVDTAGASKAVVATVQIPPIFEDVDTPCFKVFPDTESAEALHSRNQVTPRVNVAFCQRSKTAPQLAEQFRIRQVVRDVFLGKRVLAYPAAICTGETESGIMDMRILAEKFKWVSAITFEFSGVGPRR